MKKNLVVVGYGGMGGGFHCKNALTSDVVSLAGIYDIDEEKAKLEKYTQMMEQVKERLAQLR